MRVNIYTEEITHRVELVKKGEFTGVRFYLELPVALSTPPASLGAQPGIAHLSGPSQRPVVLPISGGRYVPHTAKALCGGSPVIGTKQQQVHFQQHFRRRS